MKSIDEVKKPFIMDYESFLDNPKDSDALIKCKEELKNSLRIIRNHELDKYHLWMQDVRGEVRGMYMVLLAVGSINQDQAQRISDRLL